MKSLGQNPTDTELREMILEVDELLLKFQIQYSKSWNSNSFKLHLWSAFKLIMQVDEDGSGSIEFPEFLVSQITVFQIKGLYIKYV